MSRRIPALSPKRSFPPAGLLVIPIGNLTALHVVEKAGAPDGGKCLQFADSPRFGNLYDPHACAKLNHFAGTPTR